MLRWNIVTPGDGLRTVKSSILIHVLFSLCRWNSPLSKSSLLVVRLSCNVHWQCVLPCVFASELRNAWPFWCPLFVWLVFQQYSDHTCPFDCIISDVVFLVFLQYTRLLSRQLACSQLEMAVARASSMSDHFCPSSVVYLLCGWCDVTRKYDELRLTTYQGKKRSQTIETHSNTLKNTSLGF